MRICFYFALQLCLVVTAGHADQELAAPWMAPSTVDVQGVVQEDWGTFGLEIVEPAGTVAVAQHWDQTPMPTVCTIKKVDNISLTETAYRSPIWPGGVDVVEARLANSADKSRHVLLSLDLPETVALGERVGAAAGRLTIALPADIEPIRKEKDWGCKSAVSAMPGWARPDRPCDPAFKDIVAGMGGVPIVYVFAVPVGAKRTVVVGLCESHWASPGQRPLGISVEGASRIGIDPVADWGQHVPGVLHFDAVDADQDGRIEVAVEPREGAPDQNTILNALWVFPPDVPASNDQIVAGEMTSQAEYYVNAGGENDQLLYGNDARYAFDLDAGAEAVFHFLLACPGGGPVPDPLKTAWTPASLRRAAEDVWRDAPESNQQE